ncbi:cysteine-rich DPF motif domain-containing protein 1 isoform X2 [Peromyscus maniculatus bairdii]
MASEAEPRPLGMFECQLCALTAPYSYVGQKPPDTQAVVSTSSCLLWLLLRLYGSAMAHSRMPLFHSLLEESYIMKDPFSSDKGRFLVLGARCSVCGRLVCVGPDCSLFYSKRVCLPCVQENISAFPQEIRQDVEKRKGASKRPSSHP